MDAIYTETYYVASNPTPDPKRLSALHVLFAGESQTKPSHRLGPKVYDFFLMHLVLSGKGSFTLEGTRRELTTGDSFLIRPEQLVSYESDSQEPWRYRWVAFTGAQAAHLADAAGFASGDSAVIRLTSARKAALLFAMLYQCLRRGDNTASLQSLGYLHLLLAQYRGAADGGVSRPADRDDRKHLHRRVIHYLSTQYTHPVSIEQMAESLGYNRAYLSRIFKQRTGMSPVSFLLKLRLDKARLMLRERPELTIEQIAASVGLQDALYFSKQFHRLHGQSPTSYRKEIMGE